MFIEKLSGKYIEFLYSQLTHTHTNTCPHPTPIKIPTRVTCVALTEPSLICHYHPKSAVHVGVHSWCHESESVSCSVVSESLRPLGL